MENRERDKKPTGADKAHSGYRFDPCELRDRIAKRLESASSGTVPLPFGVVEYFAGGVKLNSPSRSSGAPPREQHTKRGKIAGWSSASRRRMRRALLELGTGTSARTSDPTSGPTFGPTFTVPGPVLPLHESKSLWVDFCRTVCKAGWSMIWRVEIQKRGALHWHSIMYAPDPITVMGSVFAPGDRDYVGVCSYAIARMWKDSIEGLGPRTFDPPYRGGNGTWLSAVTSVNTLMALPGADAHCCQVSTEGGKGAWLRYLQDHATKTKQEQVGENIGRHWGIVGRKRLVRLEASGVDDLTEKQFWRFLRAFQRLTRPSVRDDRSVFGRRLGWRNSRGKSGASVWFSKPETVKRLSDWARTVEPGTVLRVTRSRQSETVRVNFRVQDVAAMTATQGKGAW